MIWIVQTIDLLPCLPPLVHLLSPGLIVISKGNVFLTKHEKALVEERRLRRFMKKLTHARFNQLPQGHNQHRAALC
jgi:hypothetical protein